MNKINWKRLIICIAIPLAAGGLTAYLNKDYFETYGQAVQPPLAPPVIFFPIAWCILYFLMGISCYIIYNYVDNGPRRTNALFTYGAQLTVNVIWPFLFFRLQTYLFAFIWIMFLWVLIIRMLVQFYRLKKTAAYMQIPYLLWCTFAAYLNFAIFLLN